MTGERSTFDGVAAARWRAAIARAFALLWVGIVAGSTITGLYLIATGGR